MKEFLGEICLISLWFFFSAFADPFLTEAVARTAFLNGSPFGGDPISIHLCHNGYFAHEDIGK